MPSRYTFTDYSPDWPKEFQREAERLKSLLGDDLIITIHHFGSTSVPGLSAKPIIDLLPVVNNIVCVEELTTEFVQAGYKPWGEYGISGRRLFTKDRDELRTHNVHIYQEGNPKIEPHLAFCAYLRSHEETRREYESLKRDAYACHPADIAAYNDHKDAWIKGVEQEALEWFRGRGI